MLQIAQWNAFWGPSGSLMRSKGPPQALRRPDSVENTNSSVLHGEYLHFTVTKHSILHLISPPCGPKISSRTAFESSLRLPVSIGAFVKTIANVGPNAHCQPLAHSMRPNLPNISRFQSIAVVQPRARGLCEHFLVSERLLGLPPSWAGPGKGRGIGGWRPNINKNLRHQA